MSRDSYTGQMVQVVNSIEDIMRKPSPAAQERKEYIQQKKVGGCDLCGAKTTLAFYHKDPRTRKFTIQEASLRIPQEVMDEEIAKCVVICVSCRMLVRGDYRPAYKIKNKDLFWELRELWNDATAPELPKRRKNGPKAIKAK